MLKQSEAGSELIHRHVTLTVETFVTWAVTSVGLGGAEVVWRKKQKAIIKRQCYQNRKYWVMWSGGHSFLAKEHKSVTYGAKTMQ